jgi:hypothetical protein
MTLAIVGGAIALFASEKVRIDLVALIVLVLLAVLGLVTPAEALAGFSNEATVTVAAMFALSLGIERSGALEPLGRMLSRIDKPWLLSLALMLAIAPMGAFVKNIALVATFLPLALRVCARTNTSPARVLMPMAYAAQMGGVCTLIGTSSNLLADSLAQKHGLPPFGVFTSEFLILTTTFARAPWLALLPALGLLVGFGALLLRLQDTIFGEPIGPAHRVDASSVPMVLRRRFGTGSACKRVAAGTRKRACYWEPNEEPPGFWSFFVHRLHRFGITTRW